MHYSLAQFVSEINSLGTETVYPYASLSGRSTNSCKLVSVDSNSGAIKFTRNGGAQVEKISSANVSKLVDALATNKAVEINSLFGGSGNARSVLEAFVVHTPHVFLCKIDGKKHVYYSHDKSHPSGEIEIDMSPNVPVYSGSVAVRKADDLGLVVGMRSEESPYGVVTVIDDDDYSYQVLCINESKHSKGIRTISKILVKEWICAVTKDPNKNANKIRGNLCGKSDIDKFEYGNEGVLIKLAKMATGQASHTMVNVSEYWGRRLGRSEKPEDKKGELPPNVDRLSVALKLFAEKRKEKGYDGWFDGGRNVNGKIREYFEPLTVEELKGFDKEKFEEFFLGVKDSDGKIVFNPMWSGGLNTGWNHVKNYIEANASDMAVYLVELKSSLDESLVFAPKCQPNIPRKPNERPSGIGPSVVSELLMKFHPERCFKHGRKVNESMSWLGLIDFPHKENFTVDEYKQVCGAAAKILGKMVDMKLPRQIAADGSEDAAKPDYLTVNEFIYFVNTNQDLIKEKVMSKALKKDKPTPYEDGDKDLGLDPESKDNELLLRLLASLRAKPFAILAGHSGTGKSRYVKKLAYMTCNAEELRNQNQLPGNYLLLQVKPNWHDSTDLLGFRNAMVGGAYQKTELIKFLFKAYHFSKTPFFLCLDEMNLAPVEQYFAEFLSAMESKEPVPLNDISEKDANLLELGCEWEDSLEYLKKNGFSIPKNLFIVGTVNMDETTNQFSRKVLDRAFTIEMTDVDFANYGKVAEPSYDDTIKEELIAQLLNGEKAVKELDEDDTKEDSSLVKVQKALASTPFAIAYRFANEYTLLKRAIECFDADGKMNLDALDQAVLMKILPRIAGERDYIEKVYGEKENEGLRGALEGKQVSLSKISEILKRAKDTNSLHITFWP